MISSESFFGRSSSGSDSMYPSNAAGTAANDYSILRTVTVGVNGTWTRSYVASADYRYFASLPNGLTSGNYLTQAR